MWVRAKEEVPSSGSEQPNVRREIISGLAFVWREPYLRAIAGSKIAWGLGGGIFGALILIYGIDELGFEAGVLGTLFAVGGISALVGATITGRITRRFGIGNVIVYGFLLLGLGSLFIPLAQGSLLIAGALLVAAQLSSDGALVAYEINEMSLRQAITPDQLLGRVNASLHFTELTSNFAGALLAAGLAELIGLRFSLLIGACIFILGAGWLALSPIRSLREPQQPSEWTSS